MTEEQIAEALRAEIDSVPVPVLVDTATAVAVIREAIGP